MTKEEKELLLKDLCARLPYGVKAHIEHDTFYDEIEPYDGTVDTNTINDLLRNEKLEVKPYLRPISSMTKEEKEEIKCRWVFTERCWDENDIADINNRGMVEICDIPSFINWLISNYFDYNGLIQMGLALEAPEGMYKDIYVDLADGKDKTVKTTYDGHGNIVKQEIK